MIARCRKGAVVVDSDQVRAAEEHVGSGPAIELVPPSLELCERRFGILGLDLDDAAFGVEAWSLHGCIELLLQRAAGAGQVRFEHAQQGLQDCAA
jgi:hypothetical protein